MRGRDGAKACTLSIHASSLVTRELLLALLLLGVVALILSRSGDGGTAMQQQVTARWLGAAHPATTEQT